MASCKQLGDFDQQQNFFRAFRINVDISGEALRQLINKKLKFVGMNLRTYLDQQKCQSFFQKLKRKNKLYAEQERILNNPAVDCSMMDITLLTLLLLNVFPCNPNEETCIYGLRKCRNDLAHALSCHLENTDIFCTTKRHLCTLCKKELDDDTSAKLLDNVRHLEGQQLLGVFQKLDVVSLHKEKLLVKLMDNSGKGM